jgi:tetratricopeptide (TPR) repeat protein
MGNHGTRVKGYVVRVLFLVVFGVSILFANIQEGDKLYDEAKAYLEKREYENALFCFELAEREYAKVGYSGDKLDTLYYSIAVGYDKLKFPKVAIDNYLKALKYIKSGSREEVLSIMKLGINYYRINEYKESLAKLKKAYKLNKVVKERVYILYVISSIYNKQNNYIVAKVYINKALAEYIKYSINDDKVWEKMMGIKEKLKEY